MTARNLARVLHAYARRKMFRPYVIEFQTGERLLIRHPEAVVILKDLIVYLDPSSRHRFFDSSSVNQVLDPLDS